jgi:Uma2 family endonuclease
LLIEVVQWHLRGRSDFFAAGNTFIHYYDQGKLRSSSRGPDFFFVANVDGRRKRRFWYVIDEGGRFPDVIIELLSPTTARMDRTTKKKVYERTFRTPEYFLYDPDTEKLEGWRLKGRTYRKIEPNEHGRLWCEELGLWLGKWTGTFQRQTEVWPRFYDTHGRLALTGAEAANQRAEAADQRAEAAEKELAQLKKRLRERGLTRPANGAADA